jgi:Mn-containing catalase
VSAELSTVKLLIFTTPAGVPMPQPTHPDSRFYGTELPNIMEKAAGTIQDKLNKE